MKFSIITDGNSELGMGHVYQSITLAKNIASKTESSEITFLTKSDASVSKLILKNGFNVNVLITDDLIFDWLKEIKPDRIIFDKLDVSPDLAQRIKTELQIKLIIFTNLTSANDFADVTVMAGMGSDFKNIYRFNKIKGRVEFWGPKYWLLREEFFKFPEKHVSNPLKNIVLLFGGADKANLSTYVLKELLLMNISCGILIVLGSAFEHRNQIDAILRDSKDKLAKVTVVSNIDKVEEALYQSDLAFVSPGLSFFEALLVGTPVICFHQNEFQRQAWNGFIKTYGVNDVNNISDLIINRKFINPSDSFIKDMEVGKGAKEIVLEICKG